MTKPTITIRTASVADARACEGLLTSLFAEDLETVCPRGSEPTLESIAAWISQHSGERAAMFLAECDDKAVGLVHLTPFKRPGTDHTVSLGLFVRNGARGKGLGRALLLRALSWFESARPIERLELEVMSNNRAAIQLYASLGFVLEGTRKCAVKRGDRYFDVHGMALVKPRASGMHPQPYPTEPTSPPDPPSRP